MKDRNRIDGRKATYLALECAKRKPVHLQPATENQKPPSSPLLPPRHNEGGEQRKAPPRLRKPDAGADRCVAPTTDLETHRKGLRETFGNTMSDEFVDVLLGKLMTGLRPGPFDKLDEATLNAALAIIDSLQPQSEHEALMAVEIVVLSLTAQRFLRMSQHMLTDDYLDFYGKYAIKLFRLETELRRTYDRHKRGNKHTMEIHHVHIHSGGQGVVGIVNTSGAGERRPPVPGEESPPAAEEAKPFAVAEEGPLAAGKKRTAHRNEGVGSFAAEMESPFAAKGRAGEESDRNGSRCCTSS
jgi:hypothetical protein